MCDSFFDLVVIAAGNKKVVEKDNVVFIGLLTKVAGNILRKMLFRGDQGKDL
jgi:hypothetical protein